ECNDSYLAEIPDDPDVARVLDELGLTIDEAAYIQGPGGYRGPDDRSVPIVADPAPPPPHIKDNNVSPSHAPTSSPSTTPKSGAPSAATTPGPSAPSAPTSGRTSGPGPALGGRRSHVDGSFTWSYWFDAHRDEFVNVRGRFHSAFPATPDPSQRARRPT